MSEAQQLYTGVTPVRYSQVLDHWDRAVSLLERVLERDEAYRSQDVLHALLGRKMQLWIVGDYQAIAVTQIQVYPVRKDLVVIWLAGDGMEEWLDELLYVLESFAKDKGCQYVEAYGRRGWKKVVASRGYEESMIVVRKQVNG